MIFGGGELLMEIMEIITDEPEFDAAWLDFCRLYNASDAEYVAEYNRPPFTLTMFVKQNSEIWQDLLKRRFHPGELVL